MSRQPRSFLIFLVVGTVLWLVVTAAAIVEVVQSPDEHGDLAVGVLLIWVVIGVFAALSRVTERI